jgi:hypothetical protein
MKAKRARTCRALNHAQGCPPEARFRFFFSFDRGARGRARKSDRHTHGQSSSSSLAETLMALIISDSLRRAFQQRVWQTHTPRAARAHAHSQNRCSAQTLSNSLPTHHRAHSPGGGGRSSSATRYTSLLPQRSCSALVATLHEQRRAPAPPRTAPQPPPAAILGRPLSDPGPTLLRVGDRASHGRLGLGGGQGQIGACVRSFVDIIADGAASK